MRTMLLYFFIFSISLGLTVLTCHVIEFERNRMYNLGVAEQRVRDYELFKEQHNKIEVLEIELWNCEHKY
jgi:hypothetical protein